MHQEIREFLAHVVSKHPDHFKDGDVLEAGSLNINGSAREYFDPWTYTGVDIGPGNGVDVIMPFHLFEKIEIGTPGFSGHRIISKFDAVVSTEMLEHDQHWEASLANMLAKVKPGGLLLITCAGPKRAEHGTRATDEYSSPHTLDYYRNLSLEDFADALPEAMFSKYYLDYGRQGEDILFYGILKTVDELKPKRISQSLPDSKLLPVTVCVPTKSRYDVLALCLLSLAQQTRPPGEIIIVDDTESPFDLRTDPNYLYILQLMSDKGIDWKVQFGKKKGQHHSHQMVQDIAKYDLIYRIDDDEVAESDVLIKLYNAITENEKVGAVAPCVLMPNAQPLPKGLTNKISFEMTSPNVQWFKWEGVMEAEHLYSSFMYRRGIQDFELTLTPVAHREETLFTHGMYRKGWKLLVLGDAKVWHFRAMEGGIRSQKDHSLWEHDELVFQVRLKEWGIEKDNTKVIVLDSGLGDHYAFLSVMKEILKKHKKIVIAACFPEAFWEYEGDPNVKLISIAEAKLLYNNIDKFQIYRWMIDNNWKGTLVEAFRKLYL